MRKIVRRSLQRIATCVMPSGIVAGVGVLGRRAAASFAAYKCLGVYICVLVMDICSPSPEDAMPLRTGSSYVLRLAGLSLVCVDWRGALLPPLGHLIV